MRKARGFTIIEILVVLIILSMVLAMAAVVTRGLAASQKRSLTTTRLAGVDAALVQFVAVQKRMPCPADGTKASADANAGVEIAPDAAGCSAQTDGVVPWRTLGLNEQDATDGWERRMTYRTDVQLGKANAMNMSFCDPAGTEAPAAPAACNVACTSSALASCTTPAAFIATKGLTVKNVAGTTVMDPAAGVNTGAAYVVISHGESGGGGYLNTGVLATTTTTDGTEEKKNYANLAIGAYYVDDSINDNPGVLHYDDTVSRPSLLGLVNKAGLGPRSH